MAKYSSKLAKEICSNVASGLSQKDSATLAGISGDGGNMKTLVFICLSLLCFSPKGSKVANFVIE